MGHGSSQYLAHGTLSGVPSLCHSKVPDGSVLELIVGGLFSLSAEGGWGLGVL